MLLMMTIRPRTEEDLHSLLIIKIIVLRFYLMYSDHWIEVMSELSYRLLEYCDKFQVHNSY